MTLRFYKGGPEAVVDIWDFWVTPGDATGCMVSTIAGVRNQIKDAYLGPRRFHQYRLTGTPAGRSYTALLPIEE